MSFIRNLFKRATSTPEKKVVVGNFFSLSFLQAADYILPLITLPYLVRVLGPAKFGLVAFAQAFAQYFVILTNYGFHMSATREISINRGDKKEITKIFSSVLLIKLCFLALSFLVLIGLVSSVPKFRNDWLIYLFTFGVVIGNALLPIWFFQGMERMKYITFLNIASKLIFTISIFVFIRKAEDYIYVPLINSLGFLIAGISGLWIVRRSFKIRFSRPDLKSIKHQLKEGWYIFISGVSVSLYTTSNTFILGLFTNNTIVGYYSAGERLIRAVQKLLSPLSNAVYPYISKLANESREKALGFIGKLTILVGGGSFIVSLGIFVFAAFITNTILGPQYQKSIIVLRILAFLPFLTSLNTMFGTQTMIPFNLKAALSKIFISAGIINIALALVLTPIYKHIGISIAVLFTESFITAIMFFYLREKRLIAFR
ncbi:MAG: flippase [Candidatus Omnitrophica bacterium]|nr:flippase [Candidatus Omnitrophota bacterium]MBU4590682.1 flippase [Candidatus Omnitrophota bacterium]